MIKLQLLNVYNALVYNFIFYSGRGGVAGGRVDFVEEENMVA